MDIELLKRFLNYLAVEKGLALNTVDSSERDLQKYFAFLKLKAPESIGPQDVRAFLSHLSSEGLATPAAARCLSAVRGFHKYLLIDGLSGSDPTENIDTPRGWIRLPKTLKGSEVESLLDQPDRSTPRGLRDKAMLELLYATGLRASELVGLREKATHVMNGGGIAAVVYNNVSGGFNGTLGTACSGAAIPGIGLSQEDGQAARAYVNQPGTVKSRFVDDVSGYETTDGTSMATPHVVGVAALVWSHGTACTNSQVRQALRSSAEDLGLPGRDDAYGYGLVRAANALSALQATGCAGGSNPNVPPTANFTYNSTELNCSLNGASSIDSDGAIVSHAWNFGDGASATGSTASHSFAAAGSYAVRLTVTDDDGATGETTKNVVVSATANSPPSASFSYNCSGLGCSFNAAGSSDSDGAIVNYAWNFGDGASATGSTASHTYAAAGTYAVNLSVTDDDGATGAASQSVTVTAPVTGNITLSAVGSQIRGWKYIRLTWSGAATSTVDIFRNGSIDGWAGVGDMPMGCVQTWGMFNSEGTADDWFPSEYIVVWSGNPVYTRIPEMHFMTEARYRGAKLIVIAPDMNATAVHADLWINPRVQTDPALALSMAQVLISERRYIADYVREQTDLPLLLRKDNGRFLRQSDLEKGVAGRVVNIASTEGVGAQPFVSAYTASKHGVIGLTRAFAVERGRRGVTFNCVCPGPIHSGMTRAIPDEAKQKFARRRVPLGRYGDPEEVAHATLSLVLPAASYVNGAVLMVDGGLSIQNN